MMTGTAVSSTSSTRCLTPSFFVMARAFSRSHLGWRVVWKVTAVTGICSLTQRARSRVLSTPPEKARQTPVSRKEKRAERRRSFM